MREGMKYVRGAKFDEDAVLQGIEQNIVNTQKIAAEHVDVPENVCETSRGQCRWEGAGIDSVRDCDGCSSLGRAANLD